MCKHHDRDTGRKTVKKLTKYLVVALEENLLAYSEKRIFEPSNSRVHIEKMIL